MKREVSQRILFNISAIIALIFNSIGLIFEPTRHSTHPKGESTLLHSVSLSDASKAKRDENGIVTMGIKEFLGDEDSLGF